MINRSGLFGNKTRVTFRLPPSATAGPISVVGSFNSWEPGRHELLRRRDGSYSVSVILGPGIHQFRYLGDGGVWFDDPHADHVDAYGGHVHI